MTAPNTTDTKNNTMTHASTKTYHHLASYPAVSEVSALLSRWEVLRLVFTVSLTSVRSVIDYINSFDFITSYWTQLDLLLDSWLSVFDKTFPAIANFSYSKTYSAAVKQVSKTVSEFNKSLESQLKRLDPVFKYTNDYYEYVLNFVLPSESKLNLNAGYSEYQRGWALITETYNRIHNTATTVSKIPNHVTETYRAELKETKSATEAVTKTTRKLSNDAYESIKPTVERVIGLNSTSTPVENLVEIKDNIAKDVAKATGVEVN